MRSKAATVVVNKTSPPVVRATGPPSRNGLKKVMLTDDDDDQKARILDSIAEVLDRISNWFGLQHDFYSYHDFAIVLFSYVQRMTKSLFYRSTQAIVQEREN
ncbi:hypothetical protein PInf_007849 [Phytophthora infestans]|nr:hypothetical protein PInf_007849 [Phytophthora infestans]